MRSGASSGEGAKQFRDQVFPAERESIRARRAALGLPRGPLTPEPTVRNDLVGLALSGGGIRSATFGLGVIQALHRFGVRGDAHPFMSYLSAGVPLALASDDEGVSRIDLTHEYHRAALTYDLGYLELKSLSRSSLQHSFLAGDPLWQSPGPDGIAAPFADDEPGGESISDACRAFLDASERARVQWRLEAAFAAFEREPWLERN